MNLLDGYLQRALLGQGCVAFVTGGSGRGKTVLVQEFARRAQERQPELIVAAGNCNAHTGEGDPCLPFREILELLTGDVEARRAARAIDLRQARRLWKLIPYSLRALVTNGPDLIDIFISGPGLLDRAAAIAPANADWLVQLQQLVARQAVDRASAKIEQQALLEQYGRVLQALARQRPLLLVLDDLQWADAGSINHILFQKYLYSCLDDVERGYLHQAVGVALEQLYQGRTEEVAGSLARHFEQAGLTEKAIGYLHQAGERAVQLSAHEEAVALFTRALSLLDTLPDPSAHSQQELDLQIALGYALIVFKGTAAPEVGRAFARARALSHQLEETPQLFHLLWGLWNFWLIRGEIQPTARELAEQCLQMAQRLRDPMLLLGAHQALGTTSLFVGELEPAQGHLEQMMALYDRQQSDALVSLYGQDLGVFCLRYICWVNWLLGYPEQALVQIDQAITLARQLAHPFSLAGALAHACTIHFLRREVQAVEKWSEECVSLSTKHGFALWKLYGMTFRGWTLAERGQVQEGLEQIRQGLAGWRATGAVSLVLYPLFLIEAHLKTGQIAAGLAELKKSFSAIEKTGEGNIEAELYRLKGELLRMGRANEGEIEACFHQAIRIAQRQRAKSWELRATMSLCRLWQAQGRKEEARQSLSEIYGWFSEGFDTPDLTEAKALLTALS